MTMYQPSEKVLAKSSAHRSYASLDDQALMTMVVAGNHDAFAELVARHSSRSLALARRTLRNVADAEDVVQAVFIKLWQRPMAWQASKSAFTTWLYRVVLNGCVDLHRASSPHTVGRLNYDIDEVSQLQTADVLDQLTESDQISRRNALLRAAIHDLPASQRDAINLAVYTGLPQRQVAEILGVSVKAVESLLIRAKATLKKSVKLQQTVSGNRPDDGQSGGKL